MASSLKTALAFFLPALAACVQLPALQPAEEVAVVSASDVDAGSIQVQARRVGAVPGAGAGAAGGALLGLACGPFAVICVPGFALYGGAGGAVVGAVAPQPGAGTEISLRSQLEERLRAHAKLHPPRDALARQIAAEATPRWTVVQPPARNMLTVHAVRGSLESGDGGELTLVLQALVSLSSTIRDKRYAEEKWFSYRGPPAGIARWLESGDGFLDASFQHAARSLARDVLADLAGR